jgi:isocitrate/isopropylmalate dehydrogenase
MSAVMMLDHLADTRHDEACCVAARRIQAGYDRAFGEGEETRDLGGSLRTHAFARAVIARLA